jgi:hypothetical protein
MIGESIAANHGGFPFGGILRWDAVGHPHQLLNYFAKMSGISTRC